MERGLAVLVQAEEVRSIGRRHDGRSAKFRQKFNVARFRLYRHRFLQENMRFAAFFKIYQIISDYQADIFENWQKFANVNLLQHLKKC